MREVKVIVSITCLSILIACNKMGSGSIIQVNEFPENSDITCVQMHLSEDNLVEYPCKVIVTDSMLFLLDLGRAADYFVHSYSLVDYLYHQSFFKRGQGPDEYLSINNIQILRDTLYAYSSTNEVVCLPLDNIGNDTEINRYKMSSDFGYLNRGHKINEYFYFPVFNSFNDNRMLELNRNGELVSSFGELVSDLSAIDIVAYQAYMPFLNGRDSILVAATQFGEVLEIYNLNDYSQTTVVGKNGYPKFQEINGFAVNKGIVGYEDVQVTERYIYALFNGESEELKVVNRQGGRYLYVYSHDGTPMLKLTLDRYIIAFFVDELNQRAYLLDVNSDTPLFYADLSAI